MELAEPIESINSYLRDDYGYYTISQPYFRVVWSEDQLEKRLGTFNDIRNGIFIREVTEVREVPKYRQWVQSKFILEGLTAVPFINKQELLEEQYSYEPIWVFEDKKGNYLPPRFIACKLILEAIRGNKTPSGFAKYRDKGETDEEFELRIRRLKEELFGNETEVGNALAQDSAVGYGTRNRNDSRFQEIKK